MVQDIGSYSEPRGKLGGQGRVAAVLGVAEGHDVGALGEHDRGGDRQSGVEQREGGSLGGAMQVIRARKDGRGHPASGG